MARPPPPPRAEARRPNPSRSHSARSSQIPRRTRADGSSANFAGLEKNFARLVTAVLPSAARDKPIEVWFGDEARVGQQGTLTYIWAERGTRPAVPRDNRHHSAWLFGAVCPDRGTAAALVLPHVSAEATGAHAVVVLDGAGWHQTGGRL